MVLMPSSLLQIQRACEAMSSSAEVGSMMQRCACWRGKSRVAVDGKVGSKKWPAYFIVILRSETDVKGWMLVTRHHLSVRGLLSVVSCSGGKGVCLRRLLEGLGDEGSCDET